ncbi:MAG: hypothetical protein P0Y62_01495 [Candidatus Chryseobacterium colombiense]|nr:hypothetical protein [Chryseobacterium sp.]WEK70229.1 MAG: hypothetical protein P0Y62_01495 [Chryseobacterium sp.]
MSRNTEIYIFNREIASKVLYNDLTDKKLYRKTFEDFINERKTEIGKSYEQILNIVKEDINRISPVELFELIYYLNEELVYGKHYEEFQVNRDVRNSIYSKYGITLLYELPGTTTCYSYMFQYGNFTHYYPIKEIKTDEDEQGQNIDAKDFLRFNDYIILLMNRILSSGINEYYKDSENYLNEFEKNILTEISLEYHDDDKFLNLIEEEFNDIKSNFEHKKNTDSPIINTIYRADSILSKSIEMKQKINPEKNTRIVIVDSY